MYCKHCGFYIAPGSRYCSHCGKPAVEIRPIDEYDDEEDLIDEHYGDDYDLGYGDMSQDEIDDFYTDIQDD